MSTVNASRVCRSTGRYLNRMEFRPGDASTAKVLSVFSLPSRFRLASSPRPDAAPPTPSFRVERRRSAGGEGRSPRGRQGSGHKTLFESYHFRLQDSRSLGLRVHFKGRWVKGFRTRRRPTPSPLLSRVPPETKGWGREGVRCVPNSNPSTELARPETIPFAGPVPVDVPPHPGLVRTSAQPSPSPRFPFLPSPLPVRPPGRIGTLFATSLEVDSPTGSDRGGRSAAAGIERPPSLPCE